MPESEPHYKISVPQKRDNAGSRAQKIKVQIQKVIKTTTVEGKGTKEDPVRTVVRYWDKNGKLIAEHDVT